jgi:hypothetical protein
LTGWRSRHNARRCPPKLIRPDHVALLASEGEASKVVDELPRNLDVLASIANAVEGAVMIFFAMLEGDACVFWSTLDDLAAGLSARWRCRMGSCLLGLSCFTVFGARGARPYRQICHSRTLRVPQGRVFVGDGDELGDSSEPPLAAALSRLVAQQLLCHGERLDKCQLTL